MRPVEQGKRERLKQKMERKMIAAIGVLLAVLLHGAEAQQQYNCISSLTACAQFIGSSNPSSACCSAMKTTVNNDLECLCSLFRNKALIDQFKVNVTQALELPKLCGISADASICDSIKTGAAPLSSPPPATPGGNSNGHALSLSVVPALTGLLLYFLSVAMV